MPRWASSIGVLIGIYTAVMLTAALWMPHEWDWAVFQWFSSRSVPAFSQQVSIVDVPWVPSDVPSNRRRIATFLDRVVASGQRPLAIVLDVEFDPCQSTPCGEPMESARAALVRSIRSTARTIPVYATEEPAVSRNDEPSGPLEPQDAQVYGAVSGAAQTRFTTIPNSEGLFYRVCYANVPIVDPYGAVQGTENVWAMVDRMLMPPGFVATAPCDTSHVPVRLGAPLSLAAPAVFPLTAQNSLPRDAQLNNRYVIVGTMEYDRSPYADRSGPELLAWALSNALDRASPVSMQTYYDTRPQNAMLLLLVPAFSGLAALAFAAIFYPLKRTRLRSLRHLLPWLAAGLAAFAGLGIFAAFEAWMLISHEIQPQVSLISLGVVLASGLSGFRGFQIVSDEAGAIDPVHTEKYDYDVFISYAHDEGAWVSEHVYTPFRNATLPNGKKLSVFFDTTTIRSGTAWQTTLALAIDASRFIVPVYSDTYFKKPYCRFEIMRAHRKWIHAGVESRCVLPIMRGHTKIDATVNDIQALSIDDHPNLVSEHIADILKRLSNEPAADASREAPAL